ncbi:MAG: hypothetical protein QOF30_1242 [Acidimicrobiaceae bacterium]|nr:hypothetical protein [Acidimicrobiaceae bacterium]
MSARESESFDARLLTDADLYEYVSIPRRTDEELRNEDPTPGQLFAGLVGAHAQLRAASEFPGRPVFIAAWARRPHRPSLRFLVGGRPFFPGALPTQEESTTRLLYPPGGRGYRVDGTEFAAELSRLPLWLRCTAKSEALVHDDGGRTRERVRRGSFEDYVAHLSALEFCWLVLAEPTDDEAVNGLLLQLEQAAPRLRKMESSEPQRVELERTQDRYRELSRARVPGVWGVHLLVGSTTRGNVRQVAGLLCSASDIAELPYLLAPGDDIGSLAETLGRRTTIADALRANSPFPATSELLAALARPPVRELPGIRAVLPHRFDVTPEVPEDSESIALGDILDESVTPAGPFAVSFKTLNRHSFVCGATGAGKSQTVRTLLEGLSRAPRRIPWMVIEPAKAEYGRMAGRLAGHDDVFVVRPGDPDKVPACINPLEPEPGYPIQSHIDLVRALFLAAFEAIEPFPQVLALAMTRTYEDLGWDLVLSEPRRMAKPKYYIDEPDVTPKPRYPTLGDLQRTAQEVVASIGYGTQVTADVRGFIDVRIGSLRLGSPGRFFEGGFPIDLGGLLERNVVFEIEDIANDQDKAFLIGIVIIRLVEHLRVKNRGVEGPVPLQHVTVVEEAHRLLKKVNEDHPARQSVELFASLLAEVRAYGEGIIVAEQIPNKIVPDVVKNSALKVLHRLPAKDDRDVVGATINLLDDHSQYVVALQPGVAAVAVDGMDWPLLVKMPGAGETRESSEKALTELPFVAPRAQQWPVRDPVKLGTLRDLRGAERIAIDPRVVIWAELVTFAHLAGVAPPMPGPGLVEWLTNNRRADQAAAAVVIAAERAVAAREVSLAEFVDPVDLVHHVVDSLKDRLGQDRRTCGGDERRWQAGVWRWVDVRKALEQDGASPGRHPLSPEWARRGLVVAGDTSSGQLAALRENVAYQRPAHRLAIGSPKVSGLDAALDELGGPDRAADHLEMTVSQVVTGGEFPYLVGIWADQIKDARDAR